MTVIGTTTRITHASPHGGVVFRLQPDSNSPSIRVRADYDVLRDAPGIGERFAVTGTFEQGHYGRQLVATAVLPEQASNASIHSLLSRNHAFAHIRVHARHLLSERMGPRLLPALETSDVTSLISAGARFRDAHDLVAAWSEYTSAVATRRFILDHGLSQQTASMTANLWGIDAIDTVRRNPYCLLAVTSWDEVDAAATTVFGCAKDDERRYLGFADSVFNDAAAHGRAGVFASELKALVKSRLGHQADAEAIFAACVQAKRMRVLQGGRHKYVQGTVLARLESQIQSRLSQILTSFDSTPMPLKKSPRLSGLAALSDKLQRHLETSSIVLLNLPGAAAAETAELLGSVTEEAVVISPTLAFTNMPIEGVPVYRLSEFLHGGETPNVTGKVVVVQEASMLDLLTANKLLRNIAGASKLVLIGDCEMLPGFGPGNIFPALEKNNAIPVVNTTRLMKSSAELSPLASLPVQMHRKAALQSFAHLVKHVPVESMQDLMSVALAHYRGVFEESPTEGIIIASTRALATSLNESMHQEVLDYSVSEGRDEGTITLQGKQIATVGDYIVYMSRDFSRGLFHGSRGMVTGVFKSATGGTRRNPAAVAQIEFDTAGLLEVTARDCQSMTLGHAVQAHHAAMSRWRTVIIAAAPSQTLNISWVRGSATRATEKLIIVELGRAFEEGLARDVRDSAYMPLSDWRPQ